MQSFVLRASVLDGRVVQLATGWLATSLSAADLRDEATRISRICQIGLKITLFTQRLLKYCVHV